MAHNGFDYYSTFARRAMLPSARDLQQSERNIQESRKRQRDLERHIDATEAEIERIEQRPIAQPRSRPRARQRQQRDNTDRSATDVPPPSQTLQVSETEEETSQRMYLDPPAAKSRRGAESRKIPTSNKDNGTAVDSHPLDERIEDPTQAQAAKMPYRKKQRGRREKMVRVPRRGAPSQFGGNPWAEMGCPAFWGPRAKCDDPDCDRNHDDPQACDQLVNSYAEGFAGSMTEQAYNLFKTNQHYQPGFDYVPASKVPEAGASPTTFAAPQPSGSNPPGKKGINP